MRELKKRVLLLLLTAAMLTSLLGVVPAEAAGASDKVPSIYKKEETYYIYKDLYAVSSVIVENVTEKSQITNLKSSNLRVAGAEAAEIGGNIYIKVITKKPGKSKISFTVKYDNNKKSKKLSFTAILKKYENPCSSVKIGSKEYRGEFKTKPEAELNVAGKKKISVKAVKSWKLRDIYYSAKEGDTPKILKNNSTVLLKKGGILYIGFTKKGKKNEHISLRVVVK